MIEYIHCAGYDFFGTHSSDEGDALFPLKSTGLDDGFDELADLSDVAEFHLLLVGGFSMVREVAECPHDDAGNENGGTHLLQVLLALLPSMAADAFG